MDRKLVETRGPSGRFTGGAWLSSARVVRCWVNSEEGGDDVKSSCPLCLGLQTCYNGRYRALRACEGERIAESRPQFGSGSATRPREAGVASNRGSAMPR